MLKSEPETKKLFPPAPVDAVPEMTVAACAENAESASPAKASVQLERKPLWMMLTSLCSWLAKPQTTEN